MKKHTIECTRIIVMLISLIFYLVVIAWRMDGVDLSMMNLACGAPTMFYLMFVVTKNREPYHIFSCLLGIPLFMFMVIDVLILTITGSWKTTLGV